MVLSDRRSERLVVQPGELNGGCCELSDLVDCEVLVLDWTQQVTIDGCHGCRVLLGPVDGSLMLRECSGVRLSAVCRQLRTRDCDECVLRLFTLKPIIESSTRMSFGPWNAAYPKLAVHLAKANIDPEAFRCKWFAVHDFNEPELAPGATPANWALLPVDTFGERWAVELELLTKDHGASENPLPLVLPYA
jgi:protein XRP2